MLLVLVTYDVSTVEQAGQRRLQRVAKVCLNFGQRVQKSVFECTIDNEQFVRLRQQLIDLIDPSTDSLRFYRLGNHWREKVEHIGINPIFDMDEPLIL